MNSIKDYTTLELDFSSSLLLQFINEKKKFIVQLFQGREGKGKT
jgi:hypothetical protein